MHPEVAHHLLSHLLAFFVAVLIGLCIGQGARIGRAIQRFQPITVFGPSCLTICLVVVIMVGWTGRRIHNAQVVDGFCLVVRTLLVLGFVFEWCNLVSFSIARLMRQHQLGHRGAHLLGDEAFPSIKFLKASAAMCSLYTLLFITYSATFSRTIFVAHLDPVLNRPVATLRYVEWSLSVPVLMWIGGELMLGQTHDRLLPPIFQTVIYIWLAWIAQMMTSEGLRMIFAGASFSIYGLATVGQWKWLESGMLLESSLLIFQILCFAGYGSVYLLVLGEVISPAAEETIYTCLDIIAKIGHSIAVMTIRRHQELYTTFASLRGYLDLMMALGELVRARFDYLIHCRTSPEGLIIAGTHLGLEHALGLKELLDKPLESICFSEEDKRRLREHAISQRPMSQSSTGRTPYERQEAMTKMAGVLPIDIVWSSSPTGFIPAELFIAGSPEGATDGVILIGVRLSETQEFQPPEASEQNASSYSQSKDDFQWYFEGEDPNAIQDAVPGEGSRAVVRPMSRRSWSWPSTLLEPVPEGDNSGENTSQDVDEDEDEDEDMSLGDADPSMMV
mmetsp:Transcript_982/g.2455  ORF Transcript_982/g.2455 Transcript_982/m.2455 type:complete len:561 (-) Transcript_982:122-1804(-)